MNKSDADKIISSYVRRLFGFAVSKLSSIEEAEELAAEITLQAYESLLKQDGIANIDGYIYRIAKNVYARYIDKRKYTAYFDGMECVADGKDFTAELAKSEDYGILRREITYLSKIQREIIVLHYFRDKKVREIADILSIPENTVKWHLACSRRELKKGMDKIRTTGNLGTQPIKFCSMGHGGTPGEKGDTSTFLAKSLTQNIAYAAYHTPRTIIEIADELGVNPIFVEDEIAVLEEYGFMDKLHGGKYRTNILITEPTEEYYKAYQKIWAKYPKLFAEKYIAPLLGSVTKIPEWLHIPDDDINLLKWLLVWFIVSGLNVKEVDGLDFCVKRPDGGNYIAFAQVDVKPDWDINDAEPNIYWACGEMWRDNISADRWWKSWQVDHNWTTRRSGWSDNLDSDYDMLYYFLKGELPETDVNAESYARLLSKGYLIKENGEYKCNLILCDSLKKWWEYIPKIPSDALSDAKEYIAEVTKAELINQPEHMHPLIKYRSQCIGGFTQTRIMKILLDMGVLKLPTEKQAKGLCTVMFTGE